MFQRKGLLALASILLTGFVVYLSPTTWGQEKPRDVDTLLGAMQIERGDWVADVGSGEGEYTLHVARAVGDSGRAFAVDIDEHDLEELNEEIEERGIENVTSISSVYDNPMLPRRSFDAALIRNAYHEFTAHERMLRHIRAALKPGGRLVMEESIESHLVGEERNRQVEEHDLGMRYARKELRQASFKIVNEVDTLRGGNGYRLWMIVATRPTGSRGS